MGTKEYGNDSIKKLVGAQRLINNPGNMLGDNGLDGCKHWVMLLTRRLQVSAIE